MTKQERLHRQDPKRAEPIRNMTAFLRDSHSWGDTPPGEEPVSGGEGETAKETIDDVLTHGVHLGYKIIDEQICQGRQVAGKLRNRSRFEGDAGTGVAGEVNALVSRLLGLTKDMGALCIDSVEMALKSPRLLAGRAGDGHGHPDGERVGVAETNISIEIASSRRTQVTLNLTPGRQPYTPQVHALHAANPAFPSLTGISFRSGPGPQGLVLLVDIPKGQSPSTYTGVVVEKETNEPVGTLVIRVLA